MSRETAGKLEGAQATVAQLEARLADAQERVRSLERDVSARDADLRASAERYGTSVEALRQQWDGEGARLRQDLTRERESGAAMQRRLTEAERERSSAVQARIETQARLEGKLEVCRADRDDLRGQLDAAHSGTGHTKRPRRRTARTRLENPRPPHAACISSPSSIIRRKRCLPRARQQSTA